MKKSFPLIIALLISAALACQAISSQHESDVLFQDDFSNSNSGWDKIATKEGVTTYRDGAYRIIVDQPNTDVWANPRLYFSDTIIEVEAKKVGGSDDNDFGVICRSVDAGNFYFFIISSDGYYGIGKVVDGQQILIGMTAMEPSEMIKKGEAMNWLHVECVGSRLGLWVNDQKVREVEDTQFTQGDVGLIAGSFGTPGTDIQFDNFSVRRPTSRD
jgi:hypothetical protein